MGAMEREAVGELTADEDDLFRKKVDARAGRRVGAVLRAVACALTVPPPEQPAPASRPLAAATTTSSLLLLHLQLAVDSALSLFKGN